MKNLLLSVIVAILVSAVVVAIVVGVIGVLHRDATREPFPLATLVLLGPANKSHLKGVENELRY